MPAIAVNDHLEIFGDRFVEVELKKGRDVIEQNRLIPRPFARKQVKQNRIVSTWLQVLQIARAELNFSRDNNTDELASHHKQPKKKLIFCSNIRHFLGARDSLFTSFTTNSTDEEMKWKLQISPLSFQLFLNSTRKVLSFSQSLRALHRRSLLFYEEMLHRLYWIFLYLTRQWACKEYFYWWCGDWISSARNTKIISHCLQVRK